MQSDSSDLLLILFKAIPAGLSLIGSFLIILFYCIYKELKEGISFRLILFIGITEFLKALIGTLNWKKTPHIYCLIMGIADYYVSYSSMMCLAIISWAMFVNAQGVPESYIKKRLCWIILIEYVIVPLPLSLVPIKHYGFDPRSYCTIIMDDTMSEFWRFLYYFIALIVLAYSLILYCLTIRYLLSESVTSIQKSLIKKLSFRMQGYLFILSLCTILPLIQRILDHLGHCPYIFEDICIFFYHSTGYLNFIVFGCTHIVRENIHHSCITKWGCKCCQPTNEDHINSSIYSEVRAPSEILNNEDYQNNSQEMDIDELLRTSETSANFQQVNGSENLKPPLKCKSFL